PKTLIAIDNKRPAKIMVSDKRLITRKMNATSTAREQYPMKTNLDEFSQPPAKTPSRPCC
ncbi:MAG TPA: hypothetical protein PK046_07160, partial [Candidatus Syntrophosphaera sp.]|nr:hypothetical protein [Candidatus Syntrophosphaera sp.]HPX67594.1 hypothetical protein [Candidatus Syntrophosphaera sp.]